MASRILGMGDILGLVEEARRGVDEEKARVFAQKLKSGKGFDLNDFKEQIAQMRKMGGLTSMIDKLPAQFAQAAGQLPAGMETKMVARIEGIINSMTPAERSNPDLLKASRKRRIAAGAGVQIQDVNRLLNQFDQMQQMMKKMKGGGLMKMMKRMGGMKGLGGMPKMPFGGS
jgi:signal recognition particle subunit SRP54